MTDSNEFANYPSLQDRVVFITGGGSGIGASLVENFVAQGAKVGFVDIDDEASNLLVAELEAKYGAKPELHTAKFHKPKFYRCDIRDIEALQSALYRADLDLGPIHTLINNAASDQRHDYASTKVDEWDNAININLRPHFFAMQSVAKSMIEQGRGSIINMSSNSCLLGLTGYPAYVASKSAILGLTKSMARELGPHGIRVNSLIPGWVMTQKQVEQWLTPEAEAELMEQQCLKQKIYPDEVARLALFLSADDSRFITKQQLVIDAGRV